MDTKALQRRERELEFINDQLTAELEYLDHILKAIGFPNGLQSCKQVAQELLTEGLEFQEEV
jgi:hypothetical protein